MSYARAVRKHERSVRKDRLFGKVTIDDRLVPVWRVEVVITDQLRFTSNRKYACEASARAAATRIEDKYL